MSRPPGALLELPAERAQEVDERVDLDGAADDDDPVAARCRVARAHDLVGYGWMCLRAHLPAHRPGPCMSSSRIQVTASAGVRMTSGMSGSGIGFPSAPGEIRTPDCWRAWIDRELLVMHDRDMPFQVEFRNLAGEATAIGSAGPFTLVVDRPTDGGLGLGFNGGQLLYLAIGGCVSNDLFREAAALGIRLRTVRVVVRGDFSGDPAVSDPVAYDVELAGDATKEQLGGARRTRRRDC